MKNKFRGIGKVFNFTLLQSVKEKSFKVTLLVVGLVVFTIALGINILMAQSASPSPVEKVYLHNDGSGLTLGDSDKTIFDDLRVTFNERFKDVKFVLLEEMDKKETVKKAEDDEEQSIVASFGKTETGFTVTVYVPGNKDVSESDGTEIGEVIADCFDTVKYSNMNLTMEQTMALMVPSTIKLSVEGEQEDTDMVVTLLQMFAPAIFGFVLYFMLIFYGQAIAKNVLAEKESKLMEYLLTGCKPYALIGGKIMAITISGLTQFIVWISCGVLGYVVGDKVAGEMYPGYKNPLFEIIDALKKMGLEDAFSARAIVFSIISLCIGFLFYCVIAGFFGSFLRKTEDVASVMSVYTMLVVAGFMVSYMGTLLEKKAIISVGRYVPICSPFMLPADILVGNMKLWESLLSLGILVLSTIIMIIATGKVYEMGVLYKGANPIAKKFKKLLRIKEEV